MGKLKNPVAIIQARMGSTRLPGKVLMPIGDKSMLQRVIERVKRAKKVKEVVVALPLREHDKPIVDLCMMLKVRCFCGSEPDVLDRYYRAAKMFEADPIVRITSDCPLVDPEVIDNCIECYEQTAHGEWVAAIVPDGLDVEVVSFRSLEEAAKKATLPYDREHVMPWIKGFYLGTMPIMSPAIIHWSVDTAEDLEFVRYVYMKLGNRFHYQDIFKLLKREAIWRSRLSPAKGS